MDKKESINNMQNVHLSVKCGCIMYTTIILHLTNYGQKKSTNKPHVLAGCRDITVWVESAGRRLCKNIIFYLENILFFCF
jgi:hypothetical protein